MAEYIDRERLKEVFDRNVVSAGVFNDIIDAQPTVNVVEKEMILDFIGDNRPTDVQTDWERGCAYICNEIEKLLM